MAPMRDRPTPDLIVMFLAAVVGFVIVFSTLGLAIAFALGRAPDVTAIAKAIGELTSSLIALIVGYVAGRGVDGNSGGGNSKPPG